MFTALLDTCVLWPSLQRDFLLSLAAEGLYRPLWSSAVLRELEHAEVHKHVRRGTPRLDAQTQATFLIEQMQAAFDDAEVPGWEGLEGTFGLPDADDEHIVAAAVVGGASAIVTVNTKDFPLDRLPAGLELLSPAEFTATTVTLGPRRAATAIDEIARGSGNKGPVRTPEDVLDLLVARYDLAAAVDLLRATR